MQKKHKDIIKQNFPTLVETIEPEKLANYLLGKKVLSKREVKRILNEKGNFKHNNRLLIFQILKKNNNAFQEFKRGLEHFQWEHLTSNIQRTHITVFNPGNQFRPDEELINNITNLNLHSPIDRNNDTSTSNTVPRNNEILLDVKVTLSTNFPQANAGDVYETKSQNRGQVLIINNKVFNSHLRREGSEHDVKCLESLFKQMFFTVTTYTDLSVIEMEKAIQEFAKYSSDKQSDICVVIIMSHGTERDKDLVILDKFNDGLNTSWVEEQFNNTNCPLFSGKPKIIFYQICRGNQHDYAITSSQGIDGAPSLVPALNDSGDSVQIDSGHMVPRVQRRLGDMLVGYATQKGYRAHRDPTLGSWYIQLICEVFMKRAHNSHIVEMLNEVDRRLKGKATPDYTMQTSSYTSNGFNKKLYFNPGIYLDAAGNIQKFV